MRNRENAHKNTSPQEKSETQKYSHEAFDRKNLKYWRRCNKVIGRGNKEHNLTLTDTKPNEEIEKEKPSLSAIKIYTSKNKTKIDRRI